jgi:carbon-monoxide dehydrogenase iron sulfur subunit
MAKVLAIDYEKCTGCRLCELVCSVKHEGVSNPARSRIRVVKWEWEGIVVPMVCQQCEEAPCLAVCPTNARLRDEELGRIVINYERCIGCKTCIAVCPFGATGFDPIAKKVIACDLCDGDPQCVRFCTTEAIRYVDASEINRERQRESARKIYESGQISTPAT